MPVFAVGREGASRRPHVCNACSMSATFSQFLGRAAFLAQIPALALPVIATAAADAGDAEHVTTPLIVGSYMFVLLGSMTLNAWLLLRHPRSFAERALPPFAAYPFVALVAVVIAWSVLLLAGFFAPSAFVFGILAAALSIVVCAASLDRLRKPSPAPRVAAVDLPTWARIVGIAYLVAAAAGLAATIVSAASHPPDDGQWSGVLIASWPLLLLGLPWSYPVFLVAFLNAASVGAPVGIAALALAVLVNAALVGLALGNPAARARLTNWFFKLRGAPNEAVAR